MIYGYFVSDKEEFSDKLDQTDLVREEIGPVPRGRTLKEVCEDSIVALYEIDGQPAGYGYGVETNYQFVILDMGILEEHRLQGYGDFIMRHIMNKALEMGYRTMYAWATPEVVDFFEAVHFVQVGDPFEYEGDVRIPMRVDPSDLRCADKKQKFNPYYGTCKMPKKYY